MQYVNNKNNPRVFCAFIVIVIVIVIVTGKSKEKEGKGRKRKEKEGRTCGVGSSGMSAVG